MRATMLLLLATITARAAPLLPPQPGRVIGEIRSARVQAGDSLYDLARRHGVGAPALFRLNPGVNLWLPAAGTTVKLPTRYVLPDAEHEGIVINLPEMRLYDYTVGPEPEVFAVAIGDRDDPTPVGEFRVGWRRVDPPWRVPDSIRAERPNLPRIVPPGPDNPLGDRWLTIGTTSYGIHGTNIAWAIGNEATHGCVRLYAADVHRLYDRAPWGTRIQLVYQPIKWGLDERAIYVEVHPDVYGRAGQPFEAALAGARALGIAGAVDREVLADAVTRARGIPERVDARPRDREAGSVRGL